MRITLPFKWKAKLKSNLNFFFLLNMLKNIKIHKYLKAVFFVFKCLAQFHCLDTQEKWKILTVSASQKPLSIVFWAIMTGSNKIYESPEDNPYFPCSFLFWRLLHCYLKVTVFLSLIPIFIIFHIGTLFSVLYLFYLEICKSNQIKEVLMK